MTQELRPNTLSSLTEDFAKLGLKAGDCVLLHASLKSLGWVCGGAVVVIQALQRVLTESGTLLMPTHSSVLSEPSAWVNPPVPESWWPIIRAEMPAYDPVLTPSLGVGQIPETFRRMPGVSRSMHPAASFAAWGAKAEFLTDNHSLEADMGEGSPLSRLYELGGRVLLLGCGHESNSSLHLSEARMNVPWFGTMEYGAPIMKDGVRQWVTYETLKLDGDDDFPVAGAAFEKACPQAVIIGRVGLAECRLMDQRALVDFGADWLRDYRRPTTGLSLLDDLQYALRLLSAEQRESLGLDSGTDEEAQSEQLLENLRASGPWDFEKQLDLIAPPGLREFWQSGLKARPAEGRQVLVARARHSTFKTFDVDSSLGLLEAVPESLRLNSLEFLLALSEFVDGLWDSKMKNLARGFMAMACLKLGAREQAVALVEAVKKEKALPEDRGWGPWEAKLSVWLAAALEQAGSIGQHRQFERALDRLIDGLEDGDHFHWRQCLISWFQALAAADMRDSRCAALVKQGLTAIPEFSIRSQVEIALKIAKPLAKLGQTQGLASLIRDLLKLDPEQYRETKDCRVNFHYIDLAMALSASVAEGRPELEDSKTIFARFRQLASELNEYCIEALTFALRCKDIDAVMVGDALASEFASAGQGSAALSVRIALLKRMQEDGQLEAARARMPKLLKDILSPPSSRSEPGPEMEYQRLGLLMCLTALIPELLSGPEGARMIEEISEFGRLHPNARVRTSIMSRCLQARVLFEASDEDSTRIEQTIEALLQAPNSLDTQEAGAGFGLYAIYVQDLFVGPVPELSESLVNKIAELALKQADQKWVPTQYWVLTTLISCCRAYQILGEVRRAEELAEQLWKIWQARVDQHFDRLDLCEKFIEAVRVFRLEKRFEWTLRILASAVKDAKDLDDHGEIMFLDFIETICHDLESDHSYGQALVKTRRQLLRSFVEQVGSESEHSNG